VPGNRTARGLTHSRGVLEHLPKNPHKGGFSGPRCASPRRRKGPLPIGRLSRFWGRRGVCHLRERAGHRRRPAARSLRTHSTTAGSPKVTAGGVPACHRQKSCSGDVFDAGPSLVGGVAGVLQRTSSASQAPPRAPDFGLDDGRKGVARRRVEQRADHRVDRAPAPTSSGRVPAWSGCGHTPRPRR
jgi:hypothetical protein